MGIFQWLGQLFDDLVEWLGEAFSAWIKRIVDKIQSYWEEEIAPILQAAFGLAKVLYVIFYITIKNIVNMEIWEPESLKSGKKAQIVALERAPSGVQIPREDQRHTGPVLMLTNALAA